MMDMRAMRRRCACVLDIQPAHPSIPPRLHKQTNPTQNTQHRPASPSRSRTRAGTRARSLSTLWRSMCGCTPTRGASTPASPSACGSCGFWRRREQRRETKRGTGASFFAFWGVCLVSKEKEAMRANAAGLPLPAPYTIINARTFKAALPNNAPATIRCDAGPGVPFPSTRAALRLLPRGDHYTVG